MNPSKPFIHALTIILSFLTIVLLLNWPIGRLRAGDWPQIQGPLRSGQAIDERPLATSWDANAPKQLWRLPAGSGYAGAVISQGYAYLFDRNLKNERITSVELATGKQRWQTKWPASYTGGYNPDTGPRAAPTLANDRIVCYGAAGELVCVDTRSGKILWQRALRKEFRAEDGFFGAGGSPLVIDEVIIANIGAKKAGVVGVDLKTGKTLWQATEYDSSYSSPIAVKVSGRAAALVPTRMRTVLLDPASGKVFSENAFEARGPSVIAATPLQLGDDRILLSASYNIGAQLLRIRGTELERIWKNAELLASHYNSPVLIGDTVVGVHGREDTGEQVMLKGIQADQQTLLWQEPLPGPAHLIAVGNQLLQVIIDGTVRLSNVTDKEVKTVASFTLPQSNQGSSVYRAPPALSNHILVVRESQDATHSEFIAYQLP